MVNVIERVKRSWLFQRPPDYVPPRRIVTILMWLAMVGTPIVTVAAFYFDARADLRSADQTRCEQRVEARQGSRARAFTNIEYVAAVIELIDAHTQIPGDLLQDLAVVEQRERELVDAQLPPITLDTCRDSPPTSPEES